MKISIIIPAWNEEKLLPSCLAAVHEARGAFTSMGWHSEVIVVDNNSTDKTAEIAADNGASVVFEKENQISRARNAGAGQAAGDWYVFTDADSWPSFDLFDDVAQAIASGTIIGGGAAVGFDHLDKIEARFLTWCWNTMTRFNRWAAGSFIFARADVFKAINGFSLELFASEEIDFSKRMKKQARKHSKKWVILREHPLVTSARKVTGVPRMKIWKQLTPFFRKGMGMLKSRDDCGIWYKREKRNDDTGTSDKGSNNE